MDEKLSLQGTKRSSMTCLLQGQNITAAFPGFTAKKPLPVYTSQRAAVNRSILVVIAFLLFPTAI
jgi:hypothetical protein